MNCFSGPCWGSLPHTPGGILVQATSMSCPPSGEIGLTLLLNAEAGRWWNTSGSLQTRSSQQLTFHHRKDGFNLPGLVMMAWWYSSLEVEEEWSDRCWGKHWGGMTSINWKLMMDRYNMYLYLWLTQICCNCTNSFECHFRVLFGDSCLACFIQQS